MPSTTLGLISGGLIAGCLLVALFFAKFWRQRRDPLFLWFGAAFLVLAVQHLLLSLSGDPLREQTALFALRLLGYLLLLVGIIDKNRRGRSRAAAPRNGGRP